MRIPRPGRPRTAVPRALLLAAAFALPAAPALASNSLHGYYEVNFDLDGTDRSWDFTTPRHLFETRFQATPWTNLDAYVRALASSATRSSTDPKLIRKEFVFGEGHLHYRWSNIETFLYSRQNRLWFSEPLFRIVKDDRVKDDAEVFPNSPWRDGTSLPQAQGIRMDFWNARGLSGLGYYNYRASGNDLAVARARQPFAGNRFAVGTTLVRQNYGTASNQFDAIQATDLEVALGPLVPMFSRLGRLTWTTEVGLNSSPVYAHEAGAIESELRDISTGPFYSKAFYRYARPGWDSGLTDQSDKDRRGNQKGYYVESNYRVPTKAVNLKAARYAYLRVDDTRDRDIERQGNIYEVYVEFIRGFTGKTEYRLDQDLNGLYPALLFEVSGENRLAKVRTQARVVNMHTRDQLEAYALEMNVNLTDRWKLYGRVLTVNEPSESRHTLFGQLRYNGWASGEAFLEFGDPDQSNDLVNDGDFVNLGSAETRQQLRSYFKLNF